MNRSPDDIFAAQFWAWPDPALKRDAHGRVLFVNAAFLQMFGGSAENWRGQVVQGWNAPQPGPHPNRFEIRTPAAHGYPEQVYDWIEAVGADGSGFALARNVTPFLEAAQSPALQPQPQPQPQHQPQTLQTQPETVPAQAELHTPPQARPQHEQPVHQAAPPPPAAEAIPVAPPAAAQPVSVAPVSGAVPAAPLEPAPVEPSPVETAPVAVAPPIAEAGANVVEVDPHGIAAAAAHDAAAQYQQAVPQQAVPQQAVAAQAGLDRPAAPPPATQAEERDFQRRALPIENDEAVLGNNWRDAVIAKAVGGGGEDSLLPGLSPQPQGGGMEGPAAKPDAIRILLAEDNAINALLTRTLLEADGHTVDTVEDGALAVEAMKSKEYDMIFMDMRMPNMDGLESTRKIRALSNVSKDLPIVALTANAFDDDRNACFDSGMNDFMTKPVSAEELSEMVVRWTTDREQKLAS
ncbi:MAG: response regulator [Pseudomonadota bacterium]